MLSYDNNWQNGYKTINWSPSWNYNYDKVEGMERGVGGEGILGKKEGELEGFGGLRWEDCRNRNSPT